MRPGGKPEVKEDMRSAGARAEDAEDRGGWRYGNPCAEQLKAEGLTIF